MVGSATGGPAQLQDLLAQLDAAGRGGKRNDLDRICREMQALGNCWPQDIRWPDASKAIDRLAQHLPRFSERQQQDIVTSFRPLRDDLTQRLADATKALTSWLSDASKPEKASVQRLTDLLQSIEATPQMRCYKQCGNSDTKIRFLWILGSFIRAAQDEAGPIYGRIRGHPPVIALAKRLASRFFDLPEHGSVLSLWHGSRLERYNAMMSMGNPMMSQLSMMAPTMSSKSSRKDDKAKKPVRVDDKLKKPDVRDRDRKDRRNKEAMIDTDDL